MPRQQDANVQSPYRLLPVSILLAETSQSYYAPSSHTTLQEEATSILTQGGSYEQTIMDSVLSLFDKFTIESCYRDTFHEKNIHYFNGWKTNNAFKLGKRLIIPIHGSYGGPFQSWSGGWSLDYQAERTIRDIDMVISYFDGMHSCKTICDAL
ncbi:MAG: DUF4942 domain-containing protein, partial [Desulfobacterales bacterium]